MTRAEIRELYAEKLRCHRETRRRRQKRVARVAYLRLLVFCVGVVVAWFVTETDRVAWPWLLLPTGAFLALLFWHGRLREALRRSERAETFFEKGLRRLDDTWAGHGHEGLSFLDPEHPYASDLDLFGKGSLFELLATTQSAWGRQTLSRWLLEPASPETIRFRQDAVRELAPLVELREEIATEHEEMAESVSAEVLASWAGAPAVLTSSVARVTAFALGLATLATLVGWLAASWGRTPFLIALVVSGLFALGWRERVRSVLADVESPASDLGVLSFLLERFEAEGFASPRLLQLQEALFTENVPASKRIRRLERLVDYLDARRNQLFAPVAALLLWGTQFAFAIESWRQRWGEAVSGWLEAVAELDALLALATYSFEHPGDAFPAIVEDRTLFVAEGLGHPLIPEDRLVRNDVRFGDELRLLIVSGSNMSGKSTFLRAVGVNTVLALAGAPVRARRLDVSPFTVAASIRIVDSLQEGISHFYAEILRLRQIMELAEGEGTLLFLLDEILHGTNSHDRRIGAEAIVRGLLDRGAVGLITTHDLALAKLAETLGGRAANVHFEDQIIGGKVQFDYVMRPGVVTKSNALELMRSIGLEV